MNSDVAFDPDKVERLIPSQECAGLMESAAVRAASVFKYVRLEDYEHLAQEYREALIEINRLSLTVASLDPCGEENESR